ncbi:MAG: glycosyltransferase family A protein [Pseudomonadota bacterium]|nr:glycosyltransferase family A protein [Pseudomonadota bacterium]
MTGPDISRSYPEISSVTLMVCTYRRPDLLPRFLESVADVRIPTGISLHVAVADNNPRSHFDDYIGSALARLKLPTSYGHEPKAGYSSARNKALELALATPSQLFAFSDDDMALDPGWLAGHLRSHSEFKCDVVGGAIQGRLGPHEHGRRFAHGEECNTQGAGNVSFRRWLVDPNGANLRFDRALDKTGREDMAFFRAARSLGARIVFSSYPVVHDVVMGGDGWLEELENKAWVSAVMQRNDIVRARREKGFATAFARALAGVRFGLKSVPGLAGWALAILGGDAGKAARKRVSAIRNFYKMTEGFRGLTGDYVARGDARRGSSAEM